MRTPSAFVSGVLFAGAFAFDGVSVVSVAPLSLPVSLTTSVSAPAASTTTPSQSM